MILMVWGVLIIKTIKEKRVIATISFYARLKVYLKVLKKQLGTENYTVLFYLYSKDIRERKGLVIPDNKDEFIYLAKQTIEFLEMSDNQVMINKRFYDLIYSLVDFLSDCLALDVFCPYSSYDNNNPIINELKIINGIIDNLLFIIDNEQIKMHKRFWKVSKSKIKKNNS